MLAKLIKLLLPFARYIGLGIIAIVVTYGIYSYFRGPRVEIIEKPGNVKEVYIDRPVLVTKEVVRYVTDKAEVQKALDENAKLKNQVTVLGETIAKLQSSGAGEIVYVNKPGPEKVVREAEFKDWRLHFTAIDDKATYTLTQFFEAISTAGRDVNSRPVISTKLFEIGPNKERFPLQNTQVTIVAASGGKRWFISPAIQAGVGVSNTTFGGFVGMQWLKRGYTKAAEDNIISLITPVVFVSRESREIGVLPISVNFGRLRNQPFKDIWLSPFVGINSKSAIKVGFSIMATF